MTPKYLLSPIAISLGFVSFNLAAEELRDWSGIYAGGMIGFANTKSTEKSSSDTFKGDVYNSINSLNFSLPSPGTGLAKSFDLPSISSGSSNNDTNIQGTGLIGVNFQNDHIVFGGEVRASFGDFGSSSNTTNHGSGSVTGYDHEGITNTLRLTNYNSVISGLPVSFNGFAELEGNYEQQITQKNEMKFDNTTSLIGRLGYAKGSLLWYALAGVNFSRVAAKTHTTIVESASGTLTEQGGPSHDFSGSSTYLFSGEHTKNMIGYTIGAGVDWAINEKFILRVEGEYHDLGTISVTGTSNQGAYSYKLKQDITGYSLATGLMYRF